MSPLYRPIIAVGWAIGVVIAFVTTLFGAFPEPTLWVVAVSHLFLAGLVRQAITSIRKQGVDWGLSRHLWFAVTVVFPLVTRCTTSTAAGSSTGRTSGVGEVTVSTTSRERSTEASV